MLGASGLAGGAIWSSKIQVTERTLQLKNWKADGFRVLFVTDVHVNDPARLNLALDAIAAARPHKVDLVAFGGDLANFDTLPIRDNVDRFMAAFADLKGPKVAILGNHEYATRRADANVQKWRELGVRVLLNESIDLDGVIVSGNDSYFSSRASRGHGIEIPQGADSHIHFWHEPDNVEAISSRPALMISGHSHGGEVCLPGGIPLALPPMARRYSCGYYGDANVPLYVSRGIGHSGPFRLYCPPEVTILTLKSIS